LCQLSGYQSYKWSIILHPPSSLFNQQPVSILLKDKTKWLLTDG
uniref:Uncharacterized protein n=1 Tax=Ciona savignyi TaxID=51511 RepID=H2YT53_CIOSA